MTNAVYAVGLPPAGEADELTSSHAYVLAPDDGNGEHFPVGASGRWTLAYDLRASDRERV